LEYKLPLVIISLLLVILVTSLVVTHRVLTRSAEQSAHERLASAAVQVATTASDALTRVIAELSTLAADPRVVALLANEGDSAAAAAASAALGEWSGGSAGIALEIRSADGRRLLAWGPESAENPPPVTGTEPVTGHMFAIDGKTYAWNVVPVVVGERVVGSVARQMGIGGPPQAVTTVHEMTGLQAAIFIRNVEDGYWAPHPFLPPDVPPALEVDDDGEYLWPGTGLALAAEAPIANTPWMAVM